jgi:hypothetical protein
MGSGTRLTSLTAALAALLLTGATGVASAAAGGADHGGHASAAVSHRDKAGPRSQGKMPPPGSVWFGTSIDWGRDSLAAYSRRLGHRPAVAVTFAGFPMSAQERVWLGQAVDQARQTGSRVLLTLEPHDGLDEVTTGRARAVARLLARYNRSGVPMVVRFAHEMNGSWYPWGQQPGAYVAAFRRVADAVHAHAPGTTMMWAPNYGGGYPFAGGPHQAPAGSADAAVLDTDHDATVTGLDDPYAPYWPGRRYVDWVGMSLYHWGAVYPWGENEVPEDDKFTDMLRGTYNGSAGDERPVPDFYTTYGARQRLPVAVTETAALYVPGRGGASEMAIKRAWWRQVLAPATTRRLPWLRMINWFEWRKHEPEVGGVVDWGVTRRSGMRRAFTAALPRWLRFAPDPT